jgi:hypothetical protein
LAAIAVLALHGCGDSHSPSAKGSRDSRQAAWIDRESSALQSDRSRGPQQPLAAGASLASDARSAVPLLGGRADPDPNERPHAWTRDPTVSVNPRINPGVGTEQDLHERARELLELELARSAPGAAINTGISLSESTTEPAGAPAPRDATVPADAFAGAESR